MHVLPLPPAPLSGSPVHPLFCAIVFVLLAPRPVAAATLTWTGAVSDRTEVAGNWSPGQVPAANDDLVWGAAGGIFVQFGAPAVQASRSWTVTGNKDIFTHKAHTISQGIRLTGLGRLTLSTIDSIIVNGDIENEGTGLVTIHQGCPVVGVDSARFSSGFLQITGSNSRLLARHLLVAGGNVNIGSGARLVASQSLALLPPASIGLSGVNSSITAPGLVVPASSNATIVAGRMKLTGDLVVNGTLLVGGTAHVDAAGIDVGPGASVGGSGTLAGPFAMTDALLYAENGKLTVGSATDPSGAVLEGTLQVLAGSELECLSASPVGLPGSVSVTNGTLRSASGFIGGDADYLTVAGTIAGDLIMLGGDFDVPWGLPGVPKLATVQGDWTHESAARKTVQLHEVGGSWEADSLVVVGQARPGGTLEIFYDEFMGTPAQPIPFLFYASRPPDRVFETVNLNYVPVTNELQIVYHPTWAEIVFSGSVSVEDDERRPAVLALSGRSGGAPALDLSLPAASEVRIHLFDVSGREVARVHEGPLAAGMHRFEIAGREAPTALSSGVYFARAAVRGGDGPLAVRTAKLVFQR